MCLSCRAVRVRDLETLTKEDDRKLVAFEKRCVNYSDILGGRIERIINNETIIQTPFEM